MPRFLLLCGLFLAFAASAWAQTGEQDYIKGQHPGPWIAGATGRSWRMTRTVSPSLDKTVGEDVLALFTFQPDGKFSRMVHGKREDGIWRYDTALKAIMVVPDDRNGQPLETNVKIEVLEMSHKNMVVLTVLTSPGHPSAFSRLYFKAFP